MGTLGSAGYFMGDNRLAPRDTNPKGFFEDSEVNHINEELIAQHLKPPIPILGKWLRRDLRNGQRWLATLPNDLEFHLTAGLQTRITAVTARTPYCYKDPRFCYTLPVWEPFLEDTGFICVFREPLATARSILKECRRNRRLENVRMTLRRAVDIWVAMYEHVLSHRGDGADWLFVHYDDVLTGDGVAKLAEFTQATVDHTFPDPRLKRSESKGSVPRQATSLYDKLCQLAEYTEDKL
jgi:hypothetical protein